MSIEEFSTAIGSASESVDTVTGAITAAKSSGEDLAAQFAALGANDKHGQTAAVCRRLEEEAAAAATQLKELLAELQQQALALKDSGLRDGGTSPRTATDLAPASRPSSTTTAATGFEPAGEWATPPKRTFGSEFNERYEQWVKASTGGPPGELEYRVVSGNGKEVWFDARRIEDRGTGKVEFLIDAKGNYGQFVESDGSDFKWFFRERGGLESTLHQAERQVRTANGRPVEWWCADEDFADVLNDYIDRDVALRGKIEAVYKPMPDTEGQ